MVVSYHPPIFRPLASLTLSNSLQASLLKCAASGISVFSPHTALDCVKGGINDWLAQGLTGLGQTTVRAIEPRENDEQVGLGRILVYRNAVPLKNIVDSMKVYLGLKYRMLLGSYFCGGCEFYYHEVVQVASVSTRTEASDIIKSVAICAGSGGTMLKDVAADLFFTGEMAHVRRCRILISGMNLSYLFFPA